MVNLWGCRDSGGVQIGVQTNEWRVETPTLHHQAAACVDRWIRFAPGGQWHDGVVYVAVSPIRPVGDNERFSKLNFRGCAILVPQGLK